MANSNIPDKYAELARKWLDGTATSAEQQEYDNWYATFDDEGLMIPPESGTNDRELRDRLFGKVIGQIQEKRNTKPLWIRFAVASSLLITLLSVGGLFYLKYQQHSETPSAMEAANQDIYFAGDKAILQLSDSSEVKLDELSDGTKVNQGSTFLTKMHDKVIYQSKAITDGRLGYNTIRVPRGGQFRVILSDGTQVWLNSASSLRFPVAFTDSTRVVELTGEAYFEVAKHKIKGASTSFKVHVDKKETIEVLGTHFNVMAYSQEPVVRTTLLEGRVKVSKYGQVDGVTLKPLEQSEFSGNKFQIKSDIDSSEAISWKEGVVRYTDADIQTIMRQIERWYNVDVSFEGKIPQRKFNGGFTRSSSLSQILKILEINDIHIRQDGRQLVVLTDYSPNQKL